MSSLVIVDSGGANIGSVRNALKRLGVDAPVTLDPGTIRDAQRLLLPGVGAAAPIMQRLNESGVAELLRDMRKPLLGICVGMQVLFERSEEGDTPCLGLLPGSVGKIAAPPGVRVPHMGWNRLRRERESPLLEGIDDGYAYFVHSYAAGVDGNCSASVEHGRRYAALVQRGHIAGVQFHPERSAQIGARLLKNFLAWNPA
ncbi:MAG: imidazole glycerol phosphate synthase subunit HisH [Rudaea sp.]